MGMNSKITLFYLNLKGQENIHHFANLDCSVSFFNSIAISG